MSGTTSGVAFTANGSETDMLIYRGKSLAFDVVWGGDAPIDITGHSAVLQVRDFQQRLLLELSTANGGAVNGGLDGKLTFSAQPAATRGVTAPGRYEIEMTTPAGLVYRVVSGAVSISEEVVQ